MLAVMGLEQPAFSFYSTTHLSNPSGVKWSRRSSKRRKLPYDDMPPRRRR